MAITNSADITLTLDADGVIQEVSFGRPFASESAEAWIGRTWEQTVTEPTQPKIRRLLDEASTSGVTGFRHVNHLLPSGVEVAVEYAAVQATSEGVIVAVGRSLRAVEELQQRLVHAQQTLERDHWRVREMETRYRMLFHRSPEAIVVLRGDRLDEAEANPAAQAVLGLEGASGRGGDVFQHLRGDRDEFRARLLRSATTGAEDVIPIRLGGGATGHAHVTPLAGDAQAARVLLVHLRTGRAPATAVPPGGALVTESDRIVAALPDGLVLIDGQGEVVATNAAFATMVELSNVGAVVGKNVTEWLGRPGADLTVLRALVDQEGAARRFATSLQGDLGSTRQVEISAGRLDTEPYRLTLVVRDVETRLTEPAPSEASRLSRALDDLGEEIGRTSLRSLVRRTVGVVERQFVSRALEMTGGNRTAAAELLGLSRQSLYAKLSKYDLDRTGLPPE